MNTTRRHPRTLQEAFGPYTSHHIQEAPEPLSFKHALFSAILVAAISAFVFIVA